MYKRIKQVIAALTANITKEDRLFINQYLTPTEVMLLLAMNVPDQRHVLNVAYTALQLAEGQPQVDVNLLVKCALLHDVGKIKGDVSTWDKIMTVIGHRVLPQWSKKGGRLGRGSRLANIRHAFYIYYHHAQRSAAMLNEMGAAPQLVEIVARHHETPADDDPLELVLLRKSDDLH